MAVLLSPVGGVAGQFFDNNGNPLTGGKLYSYVAGTTTPQATYTSSAGTVAHSNPIILDAGGRVPGGEIWLTDGLQYKFVLKNASDVLIGTYDNIIGINSNFVNFLTETEVQTATAGQTVFTLTTMQYQPGTNNLTVYVDGVNQIDGSTYSYVETSSTVITFTAGLHVGALVKFTTAQTLSTGVTDASLVTYQPPFAGGVDTTVELKLAQTVSVKDFGAVGDGVADDTAAIQAAVNYAAGSTNGSYYATCGVYFPAGKYKITSDAVLTPTTVTGLVGGVLFYGDGMNASTLRLDTTGATSDIYFYNNVSTQRMGFASFRDLGFEGMNPSAYSNYLDIPTHSKGFRFYGPGADQGFKFSRCLFTFMSTVLTTDGTDNASEIGFSQCKVSTVLGPVVYLNNVQSLNIEFYGTDIEAVYGDVFKIGPNGGGLLKVFGGSIILFPITGVDTYFLKSEGATYTIGSPITFTGVGFEFRGNTTNLYLGTENKPLEVHFNDCKMQDATSVLKPNWCNAASTNTVIFNQCVLISLVLASSAIPGSYTQINAGTIGGPLRGQSGRVIFDKCWLPVDFSDVCYVVSQNGGISASHCRGQLEENIAGTGAHWAHDFDLQWDQSVAGLYTAWDTSTTLRSVGSPQDNQLVLKTAQVKLPVETWPAFDTEKTLKLPKNSIIKSIYLRKPAAGPWTVVTAFSVGNNNKTVTHVSTTPAAYNTAQSADLEKYFYCVGSAVNDRTLRLFATNALSDGAGMGGIVYVEYY